MPDRYIRALWDSLELRAEAGRAPRIRGHAAVFNRPTVLWPGYREVVRPGAFTRAIAEDPVVGLFNHDRNIILGSTDARTLELWEDERGLGFEIPGPFSATVEDLVIAPMRRGDLRGASFQFTPIDAPEREQEDGTVLRELREVTLYDVSPVTFPQYLEAEAGLRAEQRARLDELARGLDNHDAPRGGRPSGRPPRSTLELRTRRLEQETAS